MSVSIERPNCYEMLGRERKVRLLVNLLIEKLIGLLEREPELWESAALEAGTGTPSDTSKALIFEILRGRK